MHTESTTTFAVLFTTDLTNTREASRLVLMRRFLEKGMGPGITVLDEAVFPDYGRYGFLLLLEANSKAKVEEAVAPCAGVFDTLIEPVTVAAFNREIKDAKYGLFAIKTPHSGKISAVEPAASSVYVSVRLHLTFPAGSPCSAVLLVSAPSFGIAQDFGGGAIPCEVTETARAAPMQEFFAGKMAAAKSTATSTELKDSTTIESRPSPPADGTQSYSIVNQGPLAFYIESDDAMPYGQGAKMRNLGPGESIKVASTVYLWDPSQRNTQFQMGWSNANSFDTELVFTTLYQWHSPSIVLQASSGNEYGVDASSGTSPVVSKLSIWLNDLMSSTKYDLPWPEDSYVLGQKAAYQYILTQIPGNTPPNKGTIKEPTVISTIAFPQNAQFSLSDFNAVKQHLLREIDHFITADRWFGISGIVNAINSKIAIVSTDDLIGAAELMSIPPDTSEIEVIVQAVVNSLIRVISLIPVIGNAYGAVLTIAWQVALAVRGSAKVDHTIQTTVARVAEDLVQYLQYMTDSAQYQLNILYGNWGKLKEFSAGVIEGIISADQFYSQGQVPQFTADHTPPLSQEYLEAAANAWLIIIYQRMFATVHTVKTNLSMSPTPPANPWDPDNGNYEFTWYLTASYFDGKGNLQHGYLVYDCSTDAPVPALQQLFGSGARLNVNPMEFFSGLGGWQINPPRMWFGAQLTMAIPNFPIQTLRFPGRLTFSAE